jgi:hypothetical protein
MTPDPSGLFYADSTNPQSLNLYSSVWNNPASNVDPSGLFKLCPPGSGSNRLNSDRTTTCGSTTIDLTIEPTLHTGFCSDLASCKLDPEPPPPVLKHRFAECTAPPELLGGASVQQNTQTAEDLAKMGGTWDKYLYDQFRPGGPQDFKNQLPMNSTHEQQESMTDAGNYNFGAVCTATGHSLEYCQSAAGVAALAGQADNFIHNGQNTKHANNGTPFVFAPFGDQKRDFDQIAKGSK